MPARTVRPNHNQKTRDKIQASQLVNALTNHVLGKNDMSSTQVTAATVLLRKTLPDLTATELTGAEGKDLIPDGFTINHVTADS